jgi:hypothetical protein
MQISTMIQRCNDMLLEILLGKMETASQMAPFLKGFQWPFLAFMKDFEEDEHQRLPLPPQVKFDLAV